jgi:hypothetical protein
MLLKIIIIIGIIEITTLHNEILFVKFAIKKVILLMIAIKGIVIITPLIIIKIVIIIEIKEIFKIITTKQTTKTKIIIIITKNKKIISNYNHKLLLQIIQLPVLLIILFLLRIYKVLLKLQHSL